jgi:hypothetical protein
LRVLYEHPERSQWAAPAEAPAAAGRTGGSELNLAALGVAIGGLMVAAGAFLPWATVFGISVSGMDGSDGWIALAIGGLLALIGFANLRTDATGGARLVGLLAGLAAAGLGIWKYSSVRDIGVDNELAGALVQVGTGVYLMIAGGALGVLAALGLRQR